MSSDAPAREQTPDLAFTASLRGWTGESGMLATYLPLPEAVAMVVVAHERERRLETGKRRGFGSVRVRARIGASTWQTSLFRQADGVWFLPVKAAIRPEQGLELDMQVAARLELL